MHTPTHPTGLNLMLRSYLSLISIISERISLLPPATQHEPSPILISASISSLISVLGDFQIDCRELRKSLIISSTCVGLT